MGTVVDDVHNLAGKIGNYIGFLDKNSSVRCFYEKKQQEYSDFLQILPK